MTDSTAVAALKKRRRQRGGAAALPTPEEMIAEHEPGTPLMKRRQPFLFDPAEMPVVIEIGGMVPPADFDTYYVVAEHSAAQQIVPDGCKTPISRTLWLAGQHVRRDVYALWLKENKPDTTNEGEATDG